MRTIKHIVMTTAMLAVVSMLAACGSLSHKIAQDGSGAGQLVWPAVEDTDPLHTAGTWPTPDSLRLMSPGMTKDQVMALIGAPHYSEGFANVRDWTYLFHLRDPQTGAVHVCQYKILFDLDMRARSFYWYPAGCGDFLDSQPVAAQPQTVSTVSVLFGFDESGLDDIKATGRAQLQQIAGKLKDRVSAGDRIVVDGYAGPIGSDAYNQRLSKKRAETVRQYLVTQGVPSYAIEARGYGSSQSVADCEGADGAALKACSAPDRRVEVTVVPGI